MVERGDWTTCRSATVQPLFRRTAKVCLQEKPETPFGKISCIDGSRAYLARLVGADNDGVSSRFENAFSVAETRSVRTGSHNLPFLWHRVHAHPTLRYHRDVHLVLTWATHEGGQGGLTYNMVASNRLPPNDSSRKHERGGWETSTLAAGGPTIRRYNVALG